MLVCRPGGRVIIDCGGAQKNLLDDRNVLYPNLDGVYMSVYIKFIKFPTFLYLMICACYSSIENLIIMKIGCGRGIKFSLNA